MTISREDRGTLTPEQRELFDLLSKKVRGDEPARGTIPRRPDPAASAPLSPAQHRLWFFDQLVPGSPAYNIPLVFRLSGPLDRTALERSLQEIVRRHEILRTTCVWEAGQPVQRVAPVVDVRRAGLHDLNPGSRLAHDLRPLRPGGVRLSLQFRQPFIGVFGRRAFSQVGNSIGAEYAQQFLDGQPLFEQRGEVVRHDHVHEVLGIG